MWVDKLFQEEENMVKASMNTLVNRRDIKKERSDMEVDKEHQEIEKGIEKEKTNGSRLGKVEKM